MCIIDDNFGKEEYEEAMYGMLRDEVEHAKRINAIRNQEEEEMKENLEKALEDVSKRYIKRVENMMKDIELKAYEDWKNGYRATNSTIGVVEEPFPYNIAPKQGLTSTKERAKKDNVNHPQHYNKGGIECLDVIKAFYGKEAFEGFCAGNMLKYAMRYKHKGQALDDLKKIRFYADELIKMYESTNKE